MEHPAVLLGEFDAQLGPRVSLVFECCIDTGEASGKEQEGVSADGAGLSASPWLRHVCMITGNVLLGRYIASGRLHPAYASYASCIAARVLTSHETREESVLFQDTEGPAIGSFAFTLPDILARGEKRRFCLIFLHANHDTLVRRWPVLTLLTRSIVASWTAILEDRQRNEYSHLIDLEHTREVARGRPLRSLPALLICPNQADDETAVLRRMHCTFDCALALAFADCAHTQTVYGMLDDAVPHLLASDGCYQDGLLAAWSRRLQRCLPLAETSLREFVIADEANPLTIVLQPHAPSIALASGVAQVKPLVVWLLDFARAGGSSACRETATAVVSPNGKLYALLLALFCGNQIIVTGDDAVECAMFVVALADMLPPSLAHFRVFAEEAVMPYTARIVSFSDAFMHSQQRCTTYSATAGSYTSSMSNLYGDADALCVVLNRNGIVDIARGGDVEHCVADCPCTLVSRALALLRNHCRRDESCPPLGRDSCELLTAQMAQLVREYVLRGTVYNKLYRRQEVQANESILAHLPLAATATVAGSATPLLTRLRRLFSRPAAVPVTVAGRQGCVGSANTGNLRRCNTLREPSGLAFGKERYVFSSSSSDDHAVLTFLGCAMER